MTSTQEIIWHCHDGRQLKIREIDDAHLANIIKFVDYYSNRYPAHILPAMKEEAARRKLQQGFLQRAEIPYKNKDGKWQIWSYLVDEFMIVEG